MSLPPQNIAVTAFTDYSLEQARSQGRTDLPFDHKTEAAFAQHAAWFDQKG
jgi:hypothetical protein